MLLGNISGGVIVPTSQIWGGYCIFAKQGLDTQFSPCRPQQMFDMLNIMGKARDAKTKIDAIRADQHNMRATSTSGGISVTVNGDCHLIDLVIAPELFASGDAEQLSDMIIVATNEAVVSVKANLVLRIKQETEGLLPNIPGFDLGSMLG